MTDEGDHGGAPVIDGRMISDPAPRSWGKKQKPSPGGRWHGAAVTDEGNAKVFAATTLKRPKPSPRRGEGGMGEAHAG